MGEHDPLGFAGRAGCVDQRREIPGLDGCTPGLEERSGVIRPERLDAGRELAHSRGRRIVDEEDFPEVRTAAPDLEQLAKLFGVLRHRDCGARVREDSVHLRGQQGRVDRHQHGAEVLDREVDDVPVGPIAGKERDPVALADAEAGQAPSEPGDPARHDGRRGAGSAP